MAKEKKQKTPEIKPVVKGLRTEISVLNEKLGSLQYQREKHVGIVQEIERRMVPIRQRMVVLENESIKSNKQS